jgi:hypothetical protein
MMMSDSRGGDLGDGEMKGGLVGGSRSIEKMNNLILAPHVWRIRFSPDDTKQTEEYKKRYVERLSSQLEEVNINLAQALAIPNSPYISDYNSLSVGEFSDHAHFVNCNLKTRKDRPSSDDEKAHWQFMAAVYRQALAQLCEDQRYGNIYRLAYIIDEFNPPLLGYAYYMLYAACLNEGRGHKFWFNVNRDLLSRCQKRIKGWCGSESRDALFACCDAADEMRRGLELIRSRSREGEGYAPGSLEARLLTGVYGVPLERACAPLTALVEEEDTTASTAPAPSVAFRSGAAVDDAGVADDDAGVADADAVARVAAAVDRSVDAAVDAAVAAARAYNDAPDAVKQAVDRAERAADIAGAASNKACDAVGRLVAATGDENARRTTPAAHMYVVTQYDSLRAHACSSTARKAVSNGNAASAASAAADAAYAAAESAVRNAEIVIRQVDSAICHVASIPAPTAAGDEEKKEGSAAPDAVARAADRAAAADAAADRNVADYILQAAAIGGKPDAIARAAADAASSPGGVSRYVSYVAAVAARATAKGNPLRSGGTYGLVPAADAAADSAVAAAIRSDAAFDRAHAAIKRLMDVTRGHRSDGIYKGGPNDGSYQLRRSLFFCSEAYFLADQAQEAAIMGNADHAASLSACTVDRADVAARSADLVICQVERAIASIAVPGAASLPPCAELDVSEELFAAAPLPPGEASSGVKAISGATVVAEK